METVTYIFRLKDLNLFVTNKPVGQNPIVKFSSSRKDAREFNGLEEIDLEFENYDVIKKTVIETTTYEKVEY